jgi:TonB-linked SusC/RagA family outer membrane protein
MRKLTTTLVLLLFAGLQVALAQKTITGKVLGAADNNPLSGVTVVLKGTLVGSNTDASGNYSILVPNNQAILQFSFIGFTPQEVTVGNQSVINITLAETVTQMNEVVVTALGIKREAKSLGYSTATVNTTDIAENNSVNVGNALMGKVSGLNVSAPPTGPGGSSKLRIRGQSSFGDSNSPLIVVNGVPINNASSTSGIGGDWGDGLQSINSEDIESITVLKGATAAALYGFRAKDGVLIVTTKSGAGQKGLGIELSSGIVFDKTIDYTDFQYVYGQGQVGVRPTDAAGGRQSSSWSFGEKMDGAPTYSIDGQQHPYSPVKDRFGFYETGVTVNNTLSFSGGNENGGFHFSVGDNNAKAITPNSKYDKKIIDLGLNYKFGKITLQSNINYSNEYNQNPPGSTQGLGISNTIYTTAVSTDLRWVKDLYIDPVSGNEWGISSLTNRTNPYWTAYKRFETRKRDRIFGNVLLRYDVTPWLYLQGRVAQDYFSVDAENNTPTGTLFLGAAATGFNGDYTISNSNFRETNLDWLIGVNKKFGLFAIDGQFGGNAMDQVNKSISTYVQNFYIRDLYTINNGQTKTPSQGFSEKKVNSFYGTLNLSYHDYLFLNVTARNDWFSTLNPKSNSYLYPSVGGSFLFTEAFKGIMPAWLNYGKLRASYAEVGGDTSPYGSNLTYSLNTNAFDGTYAYGGIATTTNPNPDLRPLKVKEAEAGLELIFFNRRISLDASVYRKNTVDEILNVAISSASGYSSTKVNVGRLRNQGFEGLLTLNPVRIQDFSWETAFNYSLNISKVLELAGGATVMDVSAGQMWFGLVSEEVGKPLGSLRGNDYLRDANGNIITTNGHFNKNPNLMTYGSVIPPHVGGWLNTFTYKFIRVFAQIDFKAGHKLVSQSNYNFIREGLSKSSLPGREGGVIFDGVNADGTPNTVAVEAQTFYTDYSNFKPFTPFIYNASFIKWRTLTASADLTKFVKGNIFKGLTVSASINNVLCLLKYVDNLDPECISNVSDTNAGIEQMGPPTTRSYGLTLNVKF